MTTMPATQRKPPVWLLKAANPLVLRLLGSPAHRLLSGQLLLLTYQGRRSGRTYTTPIGYFGWDDDSVISFSSSRWWMNLRDGRPVQLRIRGRWRTAVPSIAETTQDKAGLLAQFVQRHGPATARRLRWDSPATGNQHQPS